MDIVRSGSDRVGIYIDVLGIGIRIYSLGLRVLGLSSGWESSTSVKWCSRFWGEFG